MNNIIPKNKVEEIEMSLIKLDNTPECPVVHHFSDGVYVREITMPTDSIILGHKHTTTHLNIISKGSCLLVNPDTGDIHTITAPYTFESKAGVRKLLYIVEECVWSTVHVTDKKNVDDIEKDVIDKSDVYKGLINTKENKWLGLQ